MTSQKMEIIVAFPGTLCYNVVGAVACLGCAVLLLEVDTRSMEGGEEMLEILLAMSLLMICWSILLHQYDKKD